MEHYILIEENTLMHMIMSALEAFAVSEKRTKQKYLETYGTLWGSVNYFEDYNVYTISQVSIDTSAKRAKSSVEINNDALTLKIDLIKSFWPKYQFLGDFHTHPYRMTENFTYKDVERDKLYEFSEHDENDILDNSEIWKEIGYKIGLVLTIINLSKRSDKFEQNYENLIMFTIGNYRMWIKGYYFDYENNIITDDVFLRCPFLLGCEKFRQFGKFIKGKHIENI